jgi:hypothetical protein
MIFTRTRMERPRSPRPDPGGGRHCCCTARRPGGWLVRSQSSQRPSSSRAGASECSTCVSEMAVTPPCHHRGIALTDVR